MRHTLWIVILALGFGNMLQAQKIEKKWGEDSVKCHENLYIYYELAKAKNYADAWPQWKYVYDNCPGSSKNNFIYGPSIVETRIKATTDPAEKNKLIQLLMDVYDNRLVYFPEKHAYVYERKALDMLQHWPDSVQQAYDIFEKALELDKEHSAAFYNGYFIGAAKLFNKDVFEIGDVFNSYNVVIEGIEFNTDALNFTIRELQDKQDTGQTLDAKEQRELDRAERELERYDDVSSNINKILAPIATCEKLEIIYNNESYEANKHDSVWLQRAVSMLLRPRTNDEGEEETCIDNPIFIKVVEDLYKLNPTVKSARAMAKLKARNGDFNSAINYYKTAATGEVDIKQSATDYLDLAKSYMKVGRYSEAVSAANKAARVRRGWGEPYLIIAQAYAAGEGQCGTDVFEKKAVYWAAIDKLKYAKSMDPNVASRANAFINNYKQRLPDKSTSFTIGHVQGEKYNIGCYINETITADWNL